MEEDERLNSWKGISILTNNNTPLRIFPQCAELKLAWTIFSGETLIYQGGR